MAYKRYNKSKSRSRVKNSIISGPNNSVKQIRGANNGIVGNINPYYDMNYYNRWTTYIKWYNTSWEVKKIIDIPIDDAFRTAHKLCGLSSDVVNNIESVYTKFNVVDKMKKALKQERLFGGSVIMPIIRTNDDLSSKFDISTMAQGDLLGVNVVDVTKLARIDTDTNPFTPGYDRCEGLIIDGNQVDYSRIVIFDGGTLINYQSQNLLQRSYNPCGFGESKISQLYDLIVHAVGTQEAAYHLVNLSSVLLLQVDNLRSLTATNSPALEKLNEIVEQLSIYRGAVIDGKNTQITQHSASFGGVPELIYTFYQLLSAASDIPATRFLGQAPGGLNATGESDTRNYYDMVESIRNTKIKQCEEFLINMIGVSLYGYNTWKELSTDFSIEYNNLWQPTPQEHADIQQKNVQMLLDLYTNQVITKDELVEKLHGIEVL